MLKTKKNYNGINGAISIPGDKSISHRSIIIPSISKGTAEISNILFSEDVKHTINSFIDMGIELKIDNNKIFIKGNGLAGLKKPKKEIYLGNSGTSARLLTGLLSSQNFDTVLKGDDSLSKRPMGRIINPLMLMGAKFESENNKLPLLIKGKELRTINYELNIPSAQVKSGILFAALNTNGTTQLVENFITRDHTEIMLQSFGADIKISKTDNKKYLSINGKKELKSKNINVPSDLSSAAFFIVAALINKNSKIVLKNIGINPTRDGILKALKLMGAKIRIHNQRFDNFEKIGDLEVETSKLKGCELNEEMAHLMIDEYPILSIAASFAEGVSIFQGLGELKVKESNRLELIKINLNNCGAECEIVNDSLIIKPNKNLKVKNNKIVTNFDHRIAMSFAVMGSVLDESLEILDSDSIKTSFPNFIEIFNKHGGNLIE